MSTTELAPRSRSVKRGSGEQAGAVNSSGKRRSGVSAKSGSGTSGALTSSGKTRRARGGDGSGERRERRGGGESRKGATTGAVSSSPATVIAAVESSKLTCQIEACDGEAVRKCIECERFICPLHTVTLAKKEAGKQLCPDCSHKALKDARIVHQLCLACGCLGIIILICVMLGVAYGVYNYSGDW